MHHCLMRCGFNCWMNWLPLVRNILRAASVLSQILMPDRNPEQRLRATVRFYVFLSECMNLLSTLYALRRISVTVSIWIQRSRTMLQRAVMQPLTDYARKCVRGYRNGTKNSVVHGPNALSLSRLKKTLRNGWQNTIRRMKTVLVSLVR